MICALSSLQPKELNHVTVRDLESKVIALETNAGRHIVVVIYNKPTSNLSTFFKLVEQLLSLLPLHVPTTILGDFNEDLLSKPNSQLPMLMSQYGLTQQVTHPTTDYGTLLDHVYTNVNNGIVDIRDTY